MKNYICLILTITLWAFDIQGSKCQDISTEGEASKLNHVFPIKSRQLFAERKPFIVKNLLDKFKDYADRNKAINREELRRIIREAAEERAKIAEDAADPDAGHFKTFRFEQGENDSYDLTDLCNHLYDQMRGRIQARIRGMLSSGISEEWIMGDGGQTRYRLRVQSMDQWPVLLNRDVANRYIELFDQDPAIKQSDRDVVDATIHLIYAREFFYECNVLEPDGLLHYTNSIEPLLLQSLLSQLKAYPDFQPDSADSPLYYVHILEGEETEVKYVIEGDVPDVMKNIKYPSPYDVKNSKFVWVDIEHKVNEQDFYPGYGFVGFLPADKIEGTSDIPLKICHPASIYLHPFVEQYEDALHIAVTTKCKDEAQVIDNIGRFQFRWTRAMPTLRGSAALGEFDTEALYGLHGYDNIHFDQLIFYSADHAGYMYWTEEEFLEKYRRAIRLHPKDVEMEKT